MLGNQSPEQYETLFELISILNNLNDFDEIVRLLTEKITTGLQADAAFIMMVNPDTQRTIKTAMYTGSIQIDKNIRNLKMQITGWMSNNESSLLSENIIKDDRFLNLKLNDLDIQSVIASMIRIENEDIGSVIVYNSSKKRTFTDSDLSWLEKVNMIAAPYIRSLEQRRKFFKPEVTDFSLRKKYEEVGLIGQSREFIELLHVIEAAARCDVRVVLEGQTGTGKELIARAIHKFSQRRSQSFIAIDCGAIPANIIESELFGYKRGAFTGANQDRKGLIEEANNGTLFMDEIANLPFEIQSKFMRFLQEGEVRPLGSNQSKNMNVRIISASSQSLFKLIEEGKFREDLYFRLHVYPVSIPSLNERNEDIPLLSEHFLKSFSAVQNKRAQSFDTNLQNYLRRREWRGNIRELGNFIERIITTAPHEAEILKENHLPADLRKDYKQVKRINDFQTDNLSLNENIEALEAKLIRQALIEHNWNQSQAARVLKIAEHTMRYKMKKLGIINPHV
jgi:transcriptional regulator with GAF, ATPase, and Fis domain